DPTRHLPGAHRRAPEAKALSIAMRTPELSRPWVSFAPSVDDAARLGILEVDAIAECHRLKRPDPAAETAAADHDLADLPLRLCRRARVFVEDVGRGDGVAVGQRWIAVVGAENIQRLLSAL